MRFSELYEGLINVIGREELEKLPPVVVKEPCKRIFMLMTLSFSDESKIGEHRFRQKSNDIRQQSKNKYDELIKIKEYVNYLSSNVDYFDCLRSTNAESEYYHKLAKEYLIKHPCLAEVFSEGLKKTIREELNNDAHIKKCLEEVKNKVKLKGNNVDTSGWTQIIHDYIVEHPYFTEVIKKILIDDQKKKIRKELNNDAHIKKYLEKVKNKVKLKGNNVDTSKWTQIIHDYIVEHPYFTEVIKKTLSEDQKKKIDKELNNSMANDAQIKKYLEKVKDNTDLKKCAKGDEGDSGLAMIIRNYVNKYSYFNESIEKLLSEGLKNKICEELNNSMANDTQIKKYLEKVKNDIALNKYAVGYKGLVGLAKNITECPYFTVIIEKLLSEKLLSEDQKKNIFEEFNHLMDDLQIKEYLNYLKFWCTQLSDDKFRKYANGSNNITPLANIIRPYLVEHPYFIEVINNLSDDTKKKIYNKFKDYLPTISLDGSLDSLGEDLSDLLKKIINDADNSELNEFEKLWKIDEDKDNIRKMVFYPMLYQLFRYERECPYLYVINPKNSKYASDLDKYKKYNEKIDYSIKLEIRDNKKCSIIRGEHRSTDFLVKLFFFIAEKEKIYLNNKLDYLLNDIPAKCIEVGHWTLLSKPNFNFMKEVDRMSLTAHFPDVTHSFFLRERRKYSGDCVKKFFKDEPQTFKDVKHILEFKDSIDCYKDSFVWINLDPLAEFIDYYRENIEKIHESIDRQDDYWKEKSKSKLFSYINKKLKTQKMSSYFEELNRYFLKKTDYPEFTPR